MKIKRYSTELTSEDVLDVVLMWKQSGVPSKFALNYRAYIQGKWYEVYRVDNYHGFLHEQRFWRSPQPIPILHKEGWSLYLVLEEYRDEIINNFERYKSYFKKSLHENE